MFGLNRKANEATSNEYRTAYLAINAYKALVAQSEAFGRTNVDRTQIAAQQNVIREALADVSNAGEIAQLRAYWNAK